MKMFNIWEFKFYDHTVTDDGAMKPVTSEPDSSIRSYMLTRKLQQNLLMAWQGKSATVNVCMCDVLFQLVLKAEFRKV